MIDKLSDHALTLMQVLAVTPEIFPLIKTGGLADVTGALPVALARAGVDDADAGSRLSGGDGSVQEKEAGAAISDDCRAARRRCWRSKSAGSICFVLDAPHLFDRPGGPYGDATGEDWPDNWRRFAALSQVGGRHRRPARSPAGSPNRACP